MKIYNGDIEVLDVICDDASYVSNAIMGEHQAVIKFSLSEYIALPMMSFVTINGVRYVLYEPPVVKKVNSRNYEYTVTMRAESEAAKRWKLRNLVDGRLEFSMTAKPHEFVELIIGNLNLRDEGWTAGECIDAIEATISFSHNNCLEALQQIANTFNTEYEIAGKTIHLRKVEYFKDEPLHLSYGKGNGLLPNITRSNYEESQIGVLYVQGGDRNIDRSRYEASTLHLPKGGRIGYDGTHYEDEDGYSPDAARIYQADAAGMFITNAAGASTDEEDSIDCSSIYPKRVGEVSALVVVDADRNLFDIIDDTIPDALDYEECLIAGQSLTVIFQSGMLAGKEFEAKYIHADRRFEIVPQEIDGIVMPGSDYIPQSGDRYAVFGCMLPDAYINDESTKTGAEWDMMREAVKVLYEREDARFTINANLDGIWSKKNWETVGEKIRIGGYISFTDESMASEGLLIRITSIKTYINKPHSPIIELSNKVVQSSFSSSMQAIKVADLTISESQKSANRYTQIYSKYTVNNLFELVTVSEEKKDADGNITQPAEYAIKAKYDLFSVGGISIYGFSGTGSGGGTASVDVTAILKEGVHIATINGVNIYAPDTASVDVTPIVNSGTLIATINGVNIFAPKGGASSWAELTGRPSWITDPAPGVLTFPNNAGYITDTVLSAALSGYATKSEVNDVLTTVANNYVKQTDFNGYKSVVSKTISDSADNVKNWVTDKRYGKLLDTNGNYIRLLDENGIEINKVIAPYAAYTEQLGKPFEDHNGLRTQYWKKNDNYGYPTYLLISEVCNASEWASWGTEHPVYGISGTVSGARNANLSGTGTWHVNACVSYSTDYILTETSNAQWMQPCVVTYNGKVYVALRLLGSSYNIIFVGNYTNLLDNPIQVNCTDASGTCSAISVLRDYTGVRLTAKDLDVSGSLVVAQNATVNGNLSVMQSATVNGESRFNGTARLTGEYTFFGQNGIYVDADRTTEAWGSAAIIATHRDFGWEATVAAINLDGSISIPKPVGIGHDPEAGISLRVGGVLKTDTLTTGYLMAGNMARPDGYWFASPNGYFGNPSTKTYTSFGDGGIELYHDTPFIDFHYGSSTADFTTRLIASEVGVVQIQSAATTDPALRIGNAYLRYDKVNNALYVTGQNGAQVHLYATGGIAAYSGLGSGITQLANLSLTGRLTAASVKANYIESDGILRLNAGSESNIILNKNTTVDSDGWITTPQLNATQRIVVNSGGDIRIGSTAADYRITDVHADGTYVYITINGKRYRFTPSSTTTV